MKTKGLFIAAQVVVLATVLGAGIWVATVSGQFSTLVKRPRSSGGEAKGMASGEVFSDIPNLEKALMEIASPRMLRGGSVRLSAFGYQEPVRTKRGKKTQFKTEKRDFSHSLSFAFRGGSTGFCILDGAFYREGDVLPTGGKIVKVLPEKVMIREGNLARWVLINRKGMTKEGKKAKTGEKK